MRVRYRRAAAEIVFSLEGEIDLANAADVESEIRAAIAEEKRVVIDLTDVSYLDSAGLRLLFALARTLDDGLSVVIPEASHLNRVVSMVGLPKVVTILQEPPDAASGS